MSYAPCILCTCSSKHFSLLTISMLHRLQRTVLDSFLTWDLGWAGWYVLVCELILGCDGIIVVFPPKPPPDDDTGAAYSAYRVFLSEPEMFRVFCKPITSQYSGHVICVDQSEASITCRAGGTCRASTSPSASGSNSPGGRSGKTS